MRGSGSCHGTPESLTFAFLGKIVPSLPDLNCRVTQGKHLWHGGYISSLCQFFILKKEENNQCFCKAMPSGLF